MKNVLEMRRERAKLVADARAILDTATKSRREPTAEERGQFDRMMNDADKLGDDIDRIERLEKEERLLSEGQGRTTEPSQPGRQPDGEFRAAAFELKGPRSTAEYRSAYDAYLCRGPGA